MFVPVLWQTHFNIYIILTQENIKTLTNKICRIKLSVNKYGVVKHVAPWNQKCTSPLVTHSYVL